MSAVVGVEGVGDVDGGKLGRDGWLGCARAGFDIFEGGKGSREDESLWFRVSLCP
jgi:hypothetical protein